MELAKTKIYPFCNIFEAHFVNLKTVAWKSQTFYPQNGECL